MTDTTTAPATDRFPDPSPIGGFSLEQMHAIDRGAVRAYWKIGPTYVHEYWQAEGRGTVPRTRGASWDPAAVVRSRAYQYAHEHPEVFHELEQWEISAHVCDRMAQAMARESKPRKDGKGREVLVMAWGAWEDLELNVTMTGQDRPAARRWTATESPLAAPESDPEDGPDFPRLDARTLRRIGARSLEVLRIELDPGTPRPHTPSDPAGEIATRRAYSAHVWDTLAELDLLDIIDQQPAHDTRHRRPTRREYWTEVLDGNGHQRWRTDVGKATGLPADTVSAFVGEIAPAASERISAETKAMDEPAFKAAVPDIIRDETTRVLVAAFRVGICACTECES